MGALARTTEDFPVVTVAGQMLLRDNPARIRCWAGTQVVKSLSNARGDSDGVCLVRSRKECRNDDFFGDLEALVPSHLIGCIVEKTGGRAALHQMQMKPSNGGPP